MEQTTSFDMQAAWLRRFNADAESNLSAFALRLKEAMPDRVTIIEKKPNFWSQPKIAGVAVEVGDNRYTLDMTRGGLQARIALVVRGISLSTREVEPGEWFARLSAETEAATAQAKALSQSLSAFMAG